MEAFPDLGNNGQLGFERGSQTCSKLLPSPSWSSGLEPPCWCPTPLRHPGWSSPTPANLSVPVGGAGLGGQGPAHRGAMGLIHPHQEAPSPVRASSLLVPRPPTPHLPLRAINPSQPGPKPRGLDSCPADKTDWADSTLLPSPPSQFPKVNFSLLCSFPPPRTASRSTRNPPSPSLPEPGNSVSPLPEHIAHRHASRFQ